MRKINLIVVHCSATKADQECNADIIDKWHRKRGWRKIGYHYVINRSGLLETGRKLEEVGAHVKGKNKHSIGISMIGGLDANGDPECNYTKEQWKQLETLVSQLQADYPEADVDGHNSFAAKACPCFNVKEWLKNEKKALS
jgi:N-acetylmuramoyl-L-alanine amidase